MALILYLLSMMLVLELASRTVLPIRWRDRWVLAALPLVEAGEALARGRVLGPIDLAWLREPHASARAAAGVELLSPRIFYDQWCQIIPWRQAVRASFCGGGVALRIPSCSLASRSWEPNRRRSSIRFIWYRWCFLSRCPSLSSPPRPLGGRRSGCTC